MGLWGINGLQLGESAVSKLGKSLMCTTRSSCLTTWVLQTILVYVGVKPHTAMGTAQQLGKIPVLWCKTQSALLVFCFMDFWVLNICSV